jgi:hypothetical protein
VGGAVFNTDEAEDLGLAGSIPVRLRQFDVHFAEVRGLTGPVSAQKARQSPKII